MDDPESGGEATRGKARRPQCHATRTDIRGLRIPNLLNTVWQAACRAAASPEGTGDTERDISTIVVPRRLVRWGSRRIDAMDDPYAPINGRGLYARMRLAVDSDK